jgi:hypothetical protein
MEKWEQFTSYCHCISSLGHRRVPDSLLGPQLPVVRGRLSWGGLNFLQVSFRTVVACVGTDCLLKSELKGTKGGTWRRLSPFILAPGLNFGIARTMKSLNNGTVNAISP